MAMPDLVMQRLLELEEKFGKVLRNGLLKALNAVSRALWAALVEA